MEKQIKFLIKQLNLAHRAQFQKTDNVDEKFQQTDYILTRQIYGHMANDWLKSLVFDGERFFNMPTELFKMYDFIAIALNQANDSYSRKLKALPEGRLSKKELAQNFQKKLIEKCFSEYTNIEDKKREQNVIGVINFLKDVDEAAKRKE